MNLSVVAIHELPLQKYELRSANFAGLFYLNQFVPSRSFDWQSTVIGVAVSGVLSKPKHQSEMYVLRLTEVPILKKQVPFGTLREHFCLGFGYAPVWLSYRFPKKTL